MEEKDRLLVWRLPLCGTTTGELWISILLPRQRENEVNLGCMACVNADLHMIQ